MVSRQINKNDVRPLTRPPFVNPRNNLNFDRAIGPLKLMDEYNFGTGAVATAGVAGSVALKTQADVAQYFNPAQGEYDADGVTGRGGNGFQTINAEGQDYARTINGSGNHILLANGLQLKTTIGAGTFKDTLRGQIDTAGAGLNAGAYGSTVDTQLAAIGLASGLTGAETTALAALEVGDVATAGGQGFMVVTATPNGGNMRFEALTGGIKNAYKENYHITFTKYAAGILAQAAPSTAGTSAAPLVFRDALPSSAVPGMAIRLIPRVSSGAGNHATDFPIMEYGQRVLSIDNTRKIVTLDKPLNRGMVVGDAVWFQPSVTAAQIWSKKGWSPLRDGCSVIAVRIKLILPLAPHTVKPAAFFTKAQVEAALATADAAAAALGGGVVYPRGSWPAAWMYNARLGPAPDYGKLEDQIPNYNFGNEIDLFEAFVRGGAGTSGWTGFLHDKPYESFPDFRDIPNAFSVPPVAASLAARWPVGANWVAENGNANKHRSPNSGLLQLPSSLYSGTEVSFDIVWTPDIVTHYLSGNVLRYAHWKMDSAYFLQAAVNQAIASLTAGNASNLFFPAKNEDVTSQNPIVTSIKVYSDRPDLVS